jgi:hypothetical protein
LLLSFFLSFCLISLLGAGVVRCGVCGISAEFPHLRVARGNDAAALPSRGRDCQPPGLGSPTGVWCVCVCGVWWCNLLQNLSLLSFTFTLICLSILPLVLSFLVPSHPFLPCPSLPYLALYYRILPCTVLYCAGLLCPALTCCALPCTGCVCVGGVRIHVGDRLVSDEEAESRGKKVSDIVRSVSFHLRWSFLLFLISFLSKFFSVYYFSFQCFYICLFVICLRIL